MNKTSLKKSYEHTHTITWIIKQVESNVRLAIKKGFY